MWNRRSAACSIQDAFSSQPMSINTATSSAVFSFFPKKSCLCAFFCLWLSFAENIFSCCISGWQSLFHPAHKCIVQSTAKEESGEGRYIPQDGQLFHLQKEESVFWNPSLKWETRLCSGYRKESSGGIQAMPHSQATLSSKDSLCNALCIWPQSQSLFTCSSENVDPLHCLLMGLYGLMWHRQF